MLALASAPSPLCAPSSLQPLRPPARPAHNALALAQPNQTPNLCALRGLGGSALPSFATATRDARRARVACVTRDGSDGSDSSDGNRKNPSPMTAIPRCDPAMRSRDAILHRSSFVLHPSYFILSLNMSFGTPRICPRGLMPPAASSYCVSKFAGHSGPAPRRRAHAPG